MMSFFKKTSTKSTNVKCKSELFKISSQMVWTDKKKAT